MKVKYLRVLLVLTLPYGCKSSSEGPLDSSFAPDVRPEVVIIGQDIPGNEEQQEVFDEGHSQEDRRDQGTDEGDSEEDITNEGTDVEPIEIDQDKREIEESAFDSDMDAGETPFICLFDGEPCDDNDPCTDNDRCKGGECKGTPRVCNDGLECTIDYCQDGYCTYEVDDNSCLIENRCYERFDFNIENPCLYCLPEISKTGWSNADGYKCNDQDPCTEPDECHGGVCMPGPNICLPKTCSYHSDCPGQVCALWEIDGQKHCSSTCVGSTGCAPNQMCSKLQGAGAVGYCQSMIHPYGASLGAPCTDKDTCQSNMCERGVCAHFCSDETVCSIGTCFIVEHDRTELFGACAMDSLYPEGLPVGEPCTKDGGGTFDPSLCLSGHCDLTGGAKLCMHLCRTDSQCPPGRICDIIKYAESYSLTASQLKEGDSLRFHESVSGCFSALRGYKGLGDLCELSNPSECIYRKCYFDESISRSYCTTFCGSDQDCPDFMKCEIAAWPLVSEYLGQPFSQPKKPDSYTLVKICKPK